MQRQKSPVNLSPQLDKLKTLINIIPLTIDFVLGYILGHLPINSRLSTSQTRQITEVLKNIFQLRNQKVIQQNNFLQLIVVISFQLFKQTQSKRIDFKIILQEIDRIVSNLAMNQWYLSERHFKKIKPEYNLFQRIKFNYCNLSQLSNKEYKYDKFQGEKVIKSEIIKNNNIQIKEKEKQKQMQIQKQKQKMLIESGSLGIQCPICAVQISHNDVSVLTCGHILHKNCLEQYLKEVITNKKFPIKCPFGDCGVNMDTRDIEQYLSKPMLQKYYEFSFHTFVQKNQKDVSWCPTAGCPSVFQFDEDLPNYRCPNCKKNYCLKCKCQMHVGISCQLYRNLNGLSEQDKKFVDFARGLNFKQCPNCKFWVQKNQGCNHMTCRCEYEFCYVCGAEYGTCDCQSNYGEEDDEDYSEDQQQEQAIGRIHLHFHQEQQQSDYLQKEM